MWLGNDVDVLGDGGVHRGGTQPRTSELRDRKLSRALAQHAWRRRRKRFIRVGGEEREGHPGQPPSSAALKVEDSDARIGGGVSAVGIGGACPVLYLSLMHI